MTWSLVLLTALVTIPSMDAAACIKDQDLLKSRRNGESIVNRAVNEVEGVLGNSKGLLFKIAWVESRFGKDRLTFRSGYYGGIFQVDLKGFQATQDKRSHPGLSRKFEKIKKAFCIDWSQVRWNELTKPLYSAIAARLFLSNKPGAIPYSLSGQAKYWKDHYNSQYGKGTVEEFKKRWEAYLKGK